MRFQLVALVFLTLAGAAGCEAATPPAADTPPSPTQGDLDTGTTEGGEEEDLLTIGSKAPALDIENWYSNDAPEAGYKFEPGQVYVVEFWATWCGPCVMSMPHLAELQEKYAEKGVNIISVSDEDADTVNAFLEQPVRGSKEEEPPTYAELTSAYQLTSDPDRSTSDNYLRAALQGGIPTAFIVGKTGVIEWIGHPMAMDEVIADLVEDRWDRAAFAAEFREQQMLDKLQSDAIAALRSGDFDGARAIARTMAESTEDPSKQELAKRLLVFADQAESQHIIMTDPDRAVAELGKLIEPFKGDPRSTNQLAWGLYRMAVSGAPLRNDLLKAAADALEATIDEDQPQSPLLDTIGHLYHQMGELDRAIEYQERAVAAAEADGAEEQGEIEAFLEKLKTEKAAEETPADEGPQGSDSPAAG